VAIDATKDLRAVDLAQHDLGHAEAGQGEGQAPAVRVEHQ
jgi:hypothetical protein